jgi:GT2 family glycosyltransferase
MPDNSAPILIARADMHGAELLGRAALARQGTLARHRPRLAETLADLARQSAAATAAQAEQARLDLLLTRVMKDRDQAIADREAATLRHEASRSRAAETIAMLEADLAAARDARRAAEAERDIILSSTAWLTTGPMRAVVAALPSSWRRSLRRIARGSYGVMTLQAPPRMEDRADAPVIAAAPPAPKPEPPPPETEYDRWIRENDTLTEGDRDAIRAHIGRFTYHPLISVIMPTYETPEGLLRDAIASVRAQLYPHWELCIADDASPSATVARILCDAAAEEPRIKWMRRNAGGHIAATTNSALSLAVGAFVALMDHDDLLPEQALYEVAAEINAHPDVDLIYSDEDQIDGRGQRTSPYFKTDWNLELLLGHNMISHLGVYRRSLLERIGGFRGGGLNGSQDYDLALRMAAVSTPDRMRHIPSVLYHWRRTEDAVSSFSDAQPERCIAAARRAVADYLGGQGLDTVAVLPAPSARTWTRTRWPMPDPAPSVTLIVPIRDRPELLARCAAGMLHRTDYPDIELLIVDNDSTDPETAALLGRLQAADRRVRVMPFRGPFNYSALNNAAVARAHGDIIVLVNNDIDVIGSDWLREMVSHATRPDVGAVGAKLLYGDGRIQHAGIVLGVGRHGDGPGVAGHFGHGAGRDAIGYFGQFILTREVAAVTAACLAMRREVFEAIGGLDAAHLPVSFNDVDLCLRIREAGLRIIWTPFAELYHLESRSRGADLSAEQVARVAGEAEYMRARWGSVLDRDPFYNPNFDRVDHNFRLATGPPRAKPWHAYRQPGAR